MREHEMRKVWEHNFGYVFFRPYIQWAARTCYSKITVEGLENVPDAGEASVLLCSNHCNCLMDALVLLQSRREPTAYVARADVFNKPFIARILNGMGILPIYRKRDGEDSQERNVAVFDNVVECLNHGVAFSILPEGTHRARRSLLPFKKGVFRIAHQALESNPDRPVFIVPIGLDHTDFFHLMYPVKISFGKPIEIKGGEDLDVLAEELHNRISCLFPCFPDDEHLLEREKAFDESRRPRLNIGHYLLAILLLPLFLVAGILSSPMWITTALLKGGLKDKAWLNTLRFSCKLGWTPFVVAAAAIVGFILLPWYGALLLILAAVYAHPIFYGMLNLYRECLRKKK